jgi:hypothetical protein
MKVKEQLLEPSSIFKIKEIENIMLGKGVTYPTLIFAAVSFVIFLLIPHNSFFTNISEAQDKSDIKSKPSIIAPKAEQLLRGMGEFLKKEKLLSFHAEIMFDDHLPSGQKIQFAAAEDVSVRKPDRIYVDYQSDLGSKKLWYNGKSITLLSPTHNSYSTIDAPPNIESAIDILMKDYGFTVPLGDFLFSNPHNALMKNVLAGIYVGPGDVNGVDCQHLAFVEKYIDWQIWIEDGNEPVPRKVVITYKTMPNSPQYISMLSDWNFKTSFPDSLFTAKLPKDAKHIDFMKFKSSEKKLN